MVCKYPKALTHIKDTELLQDSGVCAVIVLWVMMFGQSNRFDVDQDDEGAAEHPVGHVAHHVVKVRKHIERFGTSEFGKRKYKNCRSKNVQFRQDISSL